MRNARRVTVYGHCYHGCHYWLRRRDIRWLPITLIVGVGIRGVPATTWQMPVGEEMVTLTTTEELFTVRHQC